MTLDEMQKLCDEATEGPWKYDWGNWSVERIAPGVENRDEVCRLDNGLTRHYESEDGSIYEQEATGRPYDGEFIAHARTLLPKLIAVARAAKALDEQVDMTPDMTIPGKFKAERDALVARHELRRALKALESE